MAMSATRISSNRFVGAMRLRPSPRTGQLRSGIVIQHSSSRGLGNISRATSKSSVRAISAEYFTTSIHSRSKSPQTFLQNLRARSRNFASTRRRLEAPPKQSGSPTNGGGPSASAKSAPEDTSISARFRKLTREYGWSALGVYLALSALDFPFCYLLVQYLGTDRIGAWEHAIVSTAKTVIPEPVKSTWTEWRKSFKQAEREITGNDQVSEHVEMAGWGVEKADAANKAGASLATKLALAYAIHKSFIFLRVPLTAAVTPKIVKTLRGWGWDIGKRTTKAAKAAKVAENQSKAAAKA